MISQRYRNNINGGAFRSEIVPVTVKVFGGDGETDTFTTNAPAGGSLAYDTIVNGFITLPQGEEGELLLRNRDYTKTGISGDTEYRSLFLFHPAVAVAKEIGDSPYGVERAVLTLTAAETTEDGEYEVLLVPFLSGVDGSATWTQPSLRRSTTWITEGGDSEPPLSGETPRGKADGDKIRFDITEYVNQWQISGSDQVALLVKNTGTAHKIHSWESMEGFLGDQVLQNCQFLTTGEQNSIRTEGVRVQITDSDGLMLITQSETNENRLRQFYSFQFSLSIGSTLEFFDPDTNNSITFGSKICTVVDRPSADSMVLSGFTLPAGTTTHETTAELIANGVVPYGSHILEISNPSAETKTESLGLFTDQKLKIRYFTKAANSNSKDFTVAMVSDETRYNNRIRIFLNEGVVSENRNGLDTEISLSETKPELLLHLNVY